MQNDVKPTFERALEDNKERIYRICKFYAVSPVEPEDLFQEVTLRIWKAYSTFEGKARISTWIYRIALNVCIRHKTKAVKSDGNMVRLDSIQFEPRQTLPELAMQEKYDALHDCIRSLNDIDQTIAIMVLDELSYREIAEITGLSENHVAVKMKRMKKTLLKCITSKLK